MSKGTGYNYYKEEEGKQKKMWRILYQHFIN